jgi:hypothetical protein
MAGVFTTLQWLKDSCLEALTSRFARWTKPLRTSLLLSTLNDLVHNHATFSTMARCGS